MKQQKQPCRKKTLQKTNRTPKTYCNGKKL